MLTEAWYTWHVLRSELEDTGSLTILYHFCICLSCINGQLFTDVPYLVPEYPLIQAVQAPFDGPSSGPATFSGDDGWSSGGAL